MNPRTSLVPLIAFLLASPAVLAGGSSGAPAEKPPMLALDHLGKYGGPVIYIDDDGKVWRETNGHLGLQRIDVVDMSTGSVRFKDESALLP